MLTCLGCGLDSLPDMVGRLVCSECKTGHVNRVDMITGENTLRALGDVRFSAMSKPIAKGTTKFRAGFPESPEFVADPIQSIQVGELSCSFCGRLLDKSTALTGKSKPTMRVEQEVICEDPLEFKDKFIFSSKNVTSCKDCCLEKVNDAYVNYGKRNGY